MISDLETCICTELILRLADHSASLQRASAAAAEADCLAALASLAGSGGYCRPQLREDSIVRIAKGR